MTVHVEEIPISELHEIVGGDWFETTWGVLLGSGFVAGLLGSGGFLLLAGSAGIGLVLGPPF